MSNPRQLRRPLFINREHATRELMMFAEHTAALYDARVRFEKLIKRQIETGKYDIAEGQKLWRGWLDHAAALYEKEFGGDSVVRFPEAVRDQAAVEVEEEERVLIGEGSTAAGALFKGEKPNPLARAGYGRRKALNSDLERYYSKCMSGHSAKRFKSRSRRESYCSAVSWKIARNANRYPDYFKGVKSNPLAWYALVLSAIPGRPGYTHVQAEVVDVYADRSEAMKALAREQRKTVGMDNYGMAYAVVRVKQEVSKGMILTVPVKGKKFSFDDAGSMAIKRNPLNPLTRTEYNENPCGCKENPILTDARGVPFEKPERKDYRSDADYMRAFYRYKDAIRDEANRSFNTRFMQAVRRNPILTWKENSYGRFPYTAADAPGGGTYVINKAFMQMAENAYTLQLMRGGKATSLGDYRSIADAKSAAQHHVDSGKANPLSTPVKAGLIVAGVAFVVAILYAFTKNASGATQSGQLTFVPGPSNIPVILLAPGDMGSITVISAASASNVSDTTVFNINAPTGGRILNVSSSNSNVLSGMAGSTTTSALSLGSANLPGTTTVTVSWTLNGAPVTSTFTVTAT